MEASRSAGALGPASVVVVGKLATLTIAFICFDLVHYNQQLDRISDKVGMQ